jgi:hypothetical protein
MVQINVPRPEERVAAILADPDGYFAAATARAWAEAEVDEDLAARAQRRRDHHSAGPADPQT